MIVVILILMPVLAMSLSEAMEVQPVHEDPGKHLFPEIIKVNDDFYYGRMAGKNLWHVMERVTDRNFHLWKHYINQQVIYHSTVDGHPNAPKNRGIRNEIFEDVLRTRGSHEIWVNYITKAKIPEPIPESMSTYNANYIYDKTRINDVQYMNTLKDPKHSFATDIEIVVTVTSAPSALITTHLGIAASIEGVLFGREKMTSLFLHSFGAKVMLMRNPNRKYMVNSPEWTMESLIVIALPGAVYVGTREELKTLKERLPITFEVWSEQNKEEYDKLREDLRREMKNKLHDLQYEYESMSFQDKEARKLGYEQYLKSHYLLEMGEDGKYVVSEGKLNAIVEERMKEAYKKFKTPYYFEPAMLNKETTSAEYLKYMEKYPPLLSVTNGNMGMVKFIIFDKDNPDKPWLTVEESNYDYSWMFQFPFMPHGRTHYLVVDLAALAKSRALDPVPERK